jgi:hypothetical protein
VLPPQRPPHKPGAPAKHPPSSEDALAKARREKDALEDETRKLEEELEALKARYESYFLGVERKEPVRWREETRKRVLRLKESFTRNTGLKFRIQSLHARFLSYERLWLRSAREKEEGTYRRDLFKARLRARQGEPAASEGQEPASRTETEAQEPSTPVAPVAAAPAAPASPAPPRASPPPPPAPRSAPPPTAGAGGMSDAEMRGLYDAYIAAKKSCNEDVSRLTYDAVAKSVSKQIPDIITRFKAKSVEFKVEVKAGKAILKAVPKV